MALATAIRYACRLPRRPHFGVAVLARPWLRVLEINRAANLNGWLRRLPRHSLVEYPAVDMMAMPFDDASFDLVVHSDTLEHVADPLLALRECRRVLRRRGALCYTVPIVVGRGSRSRQELPASHHGGGGDDLIVHTEFGADAWTWPLRAGFDRCEIVSVEYPAGLALVAR